MENKILSLEKLVNSFNQLPGVGLKTAQRYAYSILNMDKQIVNNFANNLIDCKNNIHYCSECGNLTDKQICDICSTRKSNVICVVKEPKDVLAIEKVKDYKGLYHVLHGCINPLQNIGPDDIKIKELLMRISKNNITEVIVATNPDVEGEATALYISKLLKPLGVKTTRIAQGISIGSELEFADAVTLSRALSNRTEI